MALCPYCQTPLGDDFGLVECPSCHKASLIDVDGNVQLTAEDGSASPLERDSSALAEDVVADINFDDFQFSPELNSAPSTPIASPIEPEFDEEPQDVSEIFRSNVTPEPSLSSQEPPAPEAPEEGAPAFQPLQEDSISTGSSPGNLRYHLTISGVDTADLRKELLEALTDQKFLWDPSKLIRSIRNGQLRIADLSPLKTAILVSRLKSTPFQLTWEQHALSTD